MKKEFSSPLQLFLGSTLLLLAFYPPGIFSMDGNGILAVAESLVQHHSLAVPPLLGIIGHHGYYYGAWYPLQSLLATPLVALAVPIGGKLALPVHYLAALFALILPVLFTAATAALVALIASELGAASKSAWLAAIGYCFGTVALCYARTFYAEPLLAFLTASALYAAIRAHHRDLLIAGALTFFAVLAKPTGVLLGPILTLSLICVHSTRRRFCFAPVAGSCLGLSLYFVYNLYRFGNPLSFGPPWAFHLSTMPAGMLGLLFSAGRGLLWYCPPVVIAVFALVKFRREHPFTSLVVSLTFVAFLLLHSVWGFWHGGWSWGPRLLLPALPGLCAFAALLEKRWLRPYVFACALGFLINSPTLFCFYERCFAEQIEAGVPEP